jgi:anti-sigma regulatory factor (Ser/Thr protein kinase)
MFGADRITATLSGMDNCAPLIPALLAVQQQFAGPSWEQEDDITLISLTRLPEPEPIQESAPAEPVTIASFTAPSTPDSERAAAEQVLAAVAGLPLTDTQRQRLFTATAETVMNAAEHGNHFRADLAINVEVVRHGNRLLVRISDSGHGGSIPETVTPDIDAKLAGLQSPRGWGLFLIEKMVDRVEVIDTSNGHTVELTVNLSETHTGMNT